MGQMRADCQTVSELRASALPRFQNASQTPVMRAAPRRVLRRGFFTGRGEALSGLEHGVTVSGVETLCAKADCPTKGWLLRCGELPCSSTARDSVVSPAIQGWRDVIHQGGTQQVMHEARVAPLVVIPVIQHRGGSASGAGGRGVALRGGGQGDQRRSAVSAASTVPSRQLLYTLFT